ncbi:Glyoxal reductase [Enhygromyxa salina]|uniref:Glyoxal reductase n=1 Tax=Enhygromyxa salina TaxID=215803 RepID=A0A2S9XJV4_9BACT|nr:aldo/keto reductase [Enhygromyxa salina]PRP93117.1 Glyoxal reductase [Enhygromyxa salina]
MTIDQTITLRNGVTMPSIAFGCAFGDWVGGSEFQGFLPEQAWRAIPMALDAGYRAFDGAHAYGTERIVGASLGQRFASGALTREDIFITTKLAHPRTSPEVNISHLRTWNADEVEDIGQRVLDDMMRSLDDLALGYVDLLLIHWPGPFENRDAALARDARRTIWRTFMALHDKGAARAIGVSNFTTAHLRELVEDDQLTTPMVNQIEAHPYCRDRDIEAYCREHGIVITAYAPFASGALGMLGDPVLTAIANKHDVAVGQVVLRWHLQSGRAVLPKTSKAHRMRENLDVFGFALDEEDMAAIDALGSGAPRRTCADPNDVV